MSEELDFAQRVARGAELLDRTHPGWATRINAGALMMDECRFCICGQLFGSYSEALSDSQDLFGIEDIDPCDYGFSVARPEGSATPEVNVKLWIERYDELGRLWLVEIERRLACSTK